MRTGTMRHVRADHYRLALCLLVLMGLGSLCRLGPSVRGFAELEHEIVGLADGDIPGAVLIAL